MSRWPSHLASTKTFLTKAASPGFYWERISKVQVFCSVSMFAHGKAQDAFSGFAAGEAGLRELLLSQFLSKA